MKIIQTPNGIQMVDDVEVKSTSMELTYEKSEVPQELIDECNRLAKETGETQFIFDSNMSNKIANHYNNKDEKREDTIDLILSDSAFHIGSETHFKELPSRFAYYDSEIRLTDRYKRYDYVVNFLKSLTFEPSFSNVGKEYEQSYTLDLIEDSKRHKFIIRVSPNLFIRIIFFGEEGQKIPYEGFFNKLEIIKSLQYNCPNSYKEILRNKKLEGILNKKETD